jgi:hypothetical protein
MSHPTTADNGWSLLHLVFEDAPGGVAIGLLQQEGRLMLAIRWCEGSDKIQPWPGHATDWFLLPFTFAAAIGRSLIQMRAAGMAGFSDAGFNTMLGWLADLEAIDDGLCY